MWKRFKSCKVKREIQCTYLQCKRWADLTVVLHWLIVWQLQFIMQRSLSNTGNISVLPLCALCWQHCMKRMCLDYVEKIPAVDDWLGRCSKLLFEWVWVSPASLSCKLIVENANLLQGLRNRSITNWLYGTSERDQEPTGWWSSEHTWLQHCQKMSQGPHSRHLDDLINWRDLVRSLD